MKKQPALQPKFPLSDVKVRQADSVRTVEHPTVERSWIRLNENEFWMSVKNVGTFYACNGKEVEFSPEPGVTLEPVELYLNGSVYGAILHQRGILPIHGSSFAYTNKGVMLCGDSGAGKSSLTAAMCLNGDAGFLTDDVTPIQFNNNRPVVMGKSDRIKLWDDSLNQLSQPKDGLRQIRPEDKKYYVDFDSQKQHSFPLHEILVLKKTENSEPAAEEMSGQEAFSVLREEIYRLYYLEGMPEKKAIYFKQLAAICNHCRIRKINRPATIPIKKMKEYLVYFVL